MFKDRKKETLKKVNFHRKMMGECSLKRLPAFVEEIINKELIEYTKNDSELLDHKFAYQGGNAMSFWKHRKNNKR